MIVEPYVPIQVDHGFLLVSKPLDLQVGVVDVRSQQGLVEFADCCDVGNVLGPTPYLNTEFVPDVA